MEELVAMEKTVLNVNVQRDIMALSAKKVRNWMILFKCYFLANIFTLLTGDMKQLILVLYVLWRY